MDSGEIYHSIKLCDWPIRINCYGFIVLTDYCYWVFERVWVYKCGMAKAGVAVWQNFRSIMTHDRREVEGTGAQHCDWIFAKTVESREKRKHIETWQSLTEIVCVPLLLFERHRLTAALSGRTSAYVVLMRWFRAWCLSIFLPSCLSSFSCVSLSLYLSFILPISSPFLLLSLSLSNGWFQYL